MRYYAVFTVCQCTHLTVTGIEKVKMTFRTGDLIEISTQKSIQNAGIFSECFCRLLNFIRISFFENSCRKTIRVYNNLDPYLARHFVMPDLGPHCLQGQQQKTLVGKELITRHMKIACELFTNIEII